METYDLVVIGGGSAGLTAAVAAAEAGATVALIERSGRFGGQCRYTGCVPTKALLHTAQVLHTMRVHAATIGLPATEPGWAWQQVLRHKDQIVLRAGGDDGYDAPATFYEHGGKTVIGNAHFRSAHELAVGDTVVRAERFIIATGSRPQIPSLPGLDETGYRTHETLLDMEELPRTLLILGGGPIGIEFAQMFQRFGSNVTIVEHAPRILPQADAETATSLQALLEAEGIQIRCDVKVKSARCNGRNRMLVLEGGEELAGDELLVAVGQHPNTSELGLEAAGVELDEKGAIKVDEQLRTSATGTFACGDVASRYQFTHIATYEAGIAVENALHNAGKSVDERVVPWAVYTDPALAQVGLTEAAARDQGIAIVTASLPLEQVERGLLVGQQAGLIKALACRDSGELLGVAMVSPRADDLIHEAALAIRLRLRARDIADTIHAYPTFSQGLEDVMRRLTAQESR